MVFFYILPSYRIYINLNVLLMYYVSGYASEQLAKFKTTL